ncbi:collagen alpha-1(I) chain-like [Oenanthe melanoleuca]|uniref:collagen alpha-1(I) chain-like n=1 Tax=Oenanthe melanoleuca TaxID=2939378 RepID=UPI0024C1BA25|nr:collagen alpha-1(I) chain-like [Oenanthe melanoleuca]
MTGKDWPWEREKSRLVSSESEGNRQPSGGLNSRVETPPPQKEILFAARAKPKYPPLGKNSFRGERREGERGGRRKLRVTLEVSSGKDGGVSGRPIPSLLGGGGRGKSQSVFGEPGSPQLSSGAGGPRKVSPGEPGPRRVTAGRGKRPPPEPGARGGGEAGRDQLSCEADPLKIKEEKNKTQKPKNKNRGRKKKKARGVGKNIKNDRLRPERSVLGGRGSARSPQVRVPAGAAGGGPPPRGSCAGRGGGGRAPGSARPEGVGAPQFPAPPTHRDAAAAAAAAAAAGGVGAAKPPPARRLPSAVPLSAAARPRHPVAAGASARVPHGRSGSGSGSRTAQLSVWKRGLVSNTGFGVHAPPSFEELISLLYKMNFGIWFISPDTFITRNPSRGSQHK